MTGVADRALAWLTDEALELRFLEDVYGGVCERLRADGLPLDRATLHLLALHPQFRAVAVRWFPDAPEVQLVRVGHEAMNSEAFRNSPVRELFEGAEALRQRLELPLPADSFSIYEDLRAQGFTDYAALPLPFSNGQRIASSWSTKRPGGWRTDELLEINRLRPFLAMAAEIRVVRRMGRNIAETYLGRRPGTQVLDGRIRRGDTETIDAALIYIDMRGFTSFTERTASTRVIDRLNRFFDAFGAAIEAHDGEILKFIGDGILAIFPVERGPEDAATRAFDTAVDGFHRLAELNAEIRQTGDEEIGCGLGLHLGPVAYGNIGTASRLDFTVIGPAVNLASRLQQLARDLSEPFVLSEAAARASGRPTRALGRHGVRGVPTAIEVFAPARDLLP